MEILEDETDILVADTGAAIFVERPQIVTCQPNHTAGRRVEACAQSQQGGLPGTAGANDGTGLAWQQAQIHLVKHGQSTAVTGRVNLAQVTNFENGLGHAVSEADGGPEGEPMVPFTSERRMAYQSLSPSDRL